MLLWNVQPTSGHIHGTCALETLYQHVRRLHRILGRSMIGKDCRNRDIRILKNESHRVSLTLHFPLLQLSPTGLAGLIGALVVLLDWQKSDAPYPVYIVVEDNFANHISTTHSILFSNRARNVPDLGSNMTKSIPVDKLNELPDARLFFFRPIARFNVPGKLCEFMFHFRWC